MTFRKIICIAAAFMLAATTLFGACTNYTRERGVENTWRSIDLSQIVPGTTTQMEIVKQLGPPSQIIDLKAGPAFYYLAEQTQGGGVILILFNHMDEKITYDRAVFFFDTQGVLLDYSLSKESISHEKK
ncbi:hypothetical protein SYK_15170 [Pseudodesulfovibrio nedwellii]|uniref:Lipoprotein SmpA/OmlA domain-containing protein n=1 Tax=Pseudodesulfovibrio nedwellii TaxID=2973072 RepID=A0ABN6S485_9BACT|nr:MULTISPECIES: hypothetical protein [Pseudodesulfovibrio]BDQ37157.1 hypothetical protein SYK_15170 [Pseudodesulfovibrio nedwellii]